MRVIDLLVKIANGEDVPKRFKYDSIVYKYSKNDEFYFDENGYSLLRHDPEFSYEFITKKIEIVEEEHKKIEEEHNFYSYSQYEQNQNDIDKIIYILKAINKCEERILELAKAVNYLLDKDKENNNEH